MAAKNQHVVDVSGREQFERWAVLPGYDGKYEVSDLGRVRKNDRLLTQRLHYSRRYPVVELCANGGHRETLVHRLVLTAFRGDPPPGTECRHLNGIRTDNRLENLAWGTHSENSIDQVQHGTHRNVQKTHCERGHEFNDENTYIRKNGTRLCLPCKRIVENAAYHRRRAAGLPR